MNLLDTLKSKIGGIPVWAIALVVIGAGVLVIRKSGTTHASTDATSSGFGTPGTIPYSGGTTFLTVTIPGPTATQSTTGGGFSKGGGSAKVTNPPARTSRPPRQLVYAAKRGDTFASIAKRFNLSPAQLLSYNISSGPNTAGRSAATIALLAKRGETVSGVGEKFIIPKRGTVYEGGF